MSDQEYVSGQPQAVTEYAVSTISAALTSVDDMRRRPPGDRVLVYLDQNSYSSLARSRDEGATAEDRAHRPLMDLLEEGVRSDQITCIDAPEHADESLISVDRDGLLETRQLLSMGVGFKGADEIMWEEIHWLAAMFTGEAPRSIKWEESFFGDPHASRDSHFLGGLQVGVDMGVADWHMEEVKRQKELEAEFESLYEADRAKGWSHEKLVAAMYDSFANIHLRKLFDPRGFEGQLLALGDRLEAAGADPFESTEEQQQLMNQFTEMAIMRGRCEHLKQRYPCIERDLPGFKLALTRSPMIALPALLRTAIVELPKRKPKPGDGYDIRHLTNGLSRCDFVTCDAGMAQLCRGANVVPSECQLFSYREHAELHIALEKAIS